MDKALERIRNWLPGHVLDLSNLGLTTLPDTLPTTLEDLWCDHNQLCSLPDTLPATLMILLCNNNHLTSLPDNLPATLIYLSCRNNQLPSLPDTLPAALVCLHCTGNQFSAKGCESVAEYITLCRINRYTKHADKMRELHTELIAVVAFRR